MTPLTPEDHKAAIELANGITTGKIALWTDDSRTAIVLARALLDRNAEVERLTRERNEARLVVGHMMKRLGDEYGVELSEEWAQRVAAGKHDVPFPESTLRDELENARSFAENYQHATKIEREEHEAELSVLRTRLEVAEGERGIFNPLRQALCVAENYMTESGPVEGSYALRRVRSAIKTFDAAMSATQPEEPAKPALHDLTGFQIDEVL